MVSNSTVCHLYVYTYQLNVCHFPLTIRINRYAVSRSIRRIEVNWAYVKWLHKGSNTLDLNIDKAIANGMALNRKYFVYIYSYLGTHLFVDLDKYSGRSVARLSSNLTTLSIADRCMSYIIPAWGMWSGWNTVAKMKITCTGRFTSLSKSEKRVFKRQFIQFVLFGKRMAVIDCPSAERSKWF